MRLATPLVTCALSTCALSSAAFANPCGKTPTTDLKIVDSWQAVYAHLNEGKRTAKTVAEATKGLCSNMDAGRPCAPDAPISVVYDYYDSTVALAFKNPNNSYAVVELPISLPPHAHYLTLKTLAKDVVHINANWEELGREMWCEGEDKDKDGNCVDGRTATVGLGHTYVDVLVNPIARTLRWSATCDHEEEAPRRMSGVTRRADGALGYASCTPSDDAQWFAFKGGKCVPAGMGIDMAASLKAARKAAKAGDLKGAIAGFDAILEASPGRTDSLSERGYLRYKAGDLAGAAADLEAARLTYPGGKMAGIIAFNQGLVKAAQGDKAGALRAFESADHRNPSKAAKAKIAEMKAALGQK